MKINNSEYGFIYMVTQSGGFAGYLYILTIEECQKFCEDKRSRGPGWCFMWTSLEHAFEGFSDSNYCGDKRSKKWLILKDTGKQDSLFEELGIEKPPFEWMDDVVGQYGFYLKYK